MSSSSPAEATHILRSRGLTNSTQPTIYAGSVMPTLPAIVKETVSLVFNMNPIKRLDFYADKSSDLWGVSMQVTPVKPLGFAALLGAFSAIAEELEFGSSSTNLFRPMISLSGKLSTGVPIAIGRSCGTAVCRWRMHDDLGACVRGSHRHCFCLCTIAHFLACVCSLRSP